MHDQIQIGAGQRLGTEIAHNVRAGPGSCLSSPLLSNSFRHLVNMSTRVIIKQYRWSPTTVYVKHDIYIDIQIRSLLLDQGGIIEGVGRQPNNGDLFFTNSH